MRIRPLSDLHLEYHKDSGKEFIGRLDTADVDLLVLPGDITHAARMGAMLEQLRKKATCPIALVPGNHEFHKSTGPIARRAINAAVRRVRGVRWLDNSIMELDGRRILGTTLWYARPTVPDHPSVVSTQDQWEHGIIRTRDKDGDVEQDLFADFEFIPDLYGWVYDAHDRSIAFLTENLREGDIVATHFLPSRLSVHPTYQDRLNTGFFVTDVQALIEERKPALWMHGHAHDSADYCIGPTRIVCNPMGYPHAPNKKFDERFTVTV